MHKAYTEYVDFQRTPRRLRLPVRFPNAIRRYRIQAAYSQRRLAQAIGRAHSMVSQWERGRRLPTLPNGFRLARALNTLVEALYPDLYHPKGTGEKR